MNSAAECRGIAAKFRRYAERTELPQLRQVHLDAAKRWDELAEEIERTQGGPRVSPPDWLT